MSSWKYYYYRTLSETHQRSIGDQNVCSETNRLIWDQHASSETFWRPTSLIRDPTRPTYQIWEQSETNMSDRRLTCVIKGWHPSWWFSNQACQYVSDQACSSTIRHVGLHDQECRSLDINIGFWSDMLVSKGSPMVCDETCWSDLRLTCLIGYQHLWWDTDMLDWIPTFLNGYQHFWMDNDMPDRILSCLIGYCHAWSDTDMPDRILTCLIRDPYQRPTFLIKYVRWVSDESCWFLIRHGQCTLRA